MSPDQVSGPSGSEPSRSLLTRALTRARWALLWERLWPALATLATALGLFLAVSWLGGWLWLPPPPRPPRSVLLPTHAGRARRPAPARPRQRFGASPRHRDGGRTRAAGARPE